MLIQEDLIEMLPAVEEANSISEELDKKKKFEVILVSPEARGELKGRTKVEEWVLLYDHSYKWEIKRYLCEASDCLTNVSRALQNILLKFVYCRNRTSCANFKLKLCTCQSHALGTRTKFQLEIQNINVISGIVYFHEIILESLQNVSVTTLLK